MNEKHFLLCRRYATAFLNLYHDQISLDDCFAIQESIPKLKAHQGWSAFFELPNVSSETRNEMITLLLKNLSLSSVLSPLVKLLDNHKRIWLLPEVLAVLRSIFFERNQLLFFQIKSCPQLSSEQLEKVVSFLMKQTKKKILYKTVEDGALLAGIRAESDILLWEYSIAKKLREAQQAIESKDTL